MQRDEWKFEYSVGSLTEAALKQKEKHLAKLKWWEEKKAATMDKVRETGISVHDSVAADYSNTKGMFGPEIQIDSGLQRDLKECQSKITSHHTQANAYDGWHQVFSSQRAEAQMSLHHDDWLYFFGE